MPNLPYFSVVVPVYAMTASLARCLECLLRQTYPRDRFEVILVDNGANAGLESLAARYPGTRVVQETRPGSYAARNRGIDAGLGEIFAFTDADCEPSSEWLSAAQKASSPSSLLGGAIEVGFSRANAPGAIELFNGWLAYDQKLFVEEMGFAATANLFVPAPILRSLGGFDATLMSAGDVDLCQRALAAGHTLRFVAEASVRHPARKSFREYLRWTLRLAGGRHQLMRRGVGDSWSRRPLRERVLRLRRLLLLPDAKVHRPALVGLAVMTEILTRLERARLSWGGTPRRA